MEIFTRLVCFSSMVFIGIPVFSFLSVFGYFPMEEKYAPIRPNDTFVHIALCGWATICSILAVVAVWILATVWAALGFLVVASLMMPSLIKAAGGLVLDYMLRRELGTMNK